MRDAIAPRMNSAFSGPRYMSTPPPIVCAIPPGTVSAYVSFPTPYTRNRPRSLSNSLAVFCCTLVGFRQKYPLSPNRGTGWNLRHTRNRGHSRVRSPRSRQLPSGIVWPGLIEFWASSTANKATTTQGCLHWPGALYCCVHRFMLLMWNLNP